MLLRETMWDLFLSTGNIDAYLAYRACLDCPSNCQQDPEDEATKSLVVPKYFYNHFLREVKWH